MDRIRIRGLRVRGRHGVLPAEAELGQVFVIDLEMAVDTREASLSDSVADTVDYGAVAARVASVVGGERWNLIERVALRVCETVLEHEGVEEVTVTVHKPAAPIPLVFDDVSVTITRSR